MNVLQVIPTYLPAWRHGGPALAVHGLSRALAAAGHRISVFTTNLHGDTFLEVEPDAPIDRDGVEVRYFPVPRPRRLCSSPAMKRALVAGVDAFDVLHLHSVFLAFTSSAARIAEQAGKPYVLAPRGMLVPELLRSRGRLRKSLWLRAVERRTIERASAIHVTTELEATDLGRMALDLPPIHVVPNGVDVDALLADRSMAPSEAIASAIAAGPYFLFLGRISWKKGLDRLISWIAGLEGARLLIAGNDEERLQPSLEQQARERGAADRIRFCGAVHGADRAALLAGALALVLPSHSENFGNVVIEAMALGAPVVVTPEVGLAATVADEGAGLVVAGEAEAWTGALTRLICDTEARTAMGRRGLEAARRRFDWSRVAAAMVEVYDAAVSTAEAAPRRR
ncbi:MAG TPA: glycosyltransferase [Thermoanaerobaculia bacterium]|nr:glycosyltransferase [Thermoanaerobaculia bacterium]